MAKIIFTEVANAAGFNLADSLTLKGDNLTLNFEWSYDATVPCDPKAKCLDKFRVYIGKAAAGAWNKAATEAAKKVQLKFKTMDEKMGKFVADVKKYNIRDAEGTVQAEIDKYQAALQIELDELIKKDIGEDFLGKAEEAARKQLLKEGTKVEPSKMKIVKKVLKVVLLLAVAAAAIVAAVMTGGAAVPVIIAVGTWVALAVGTTKRLVAVGSTLQKLHADLQNNTVQMEKKLAEIDVLFDKAVTFANQMEAKADAIELSVQELKKEIAEGKKTLDKVDMNSKHPLAGQAKDLQAKIEKLEAEMKKSEAARAYAEPLRNALVEFRKVKNDQTWGTKFESAKTLATVANYIAKGFKDIASLIVK
jgi:hypothetical protein